MPFIKYRFPRARILPVLMGDQEYASAELLAKKVLDAINQTGRDDIRFVASSDFSHYVPIAAARENDGYAIEALTSLDLPEFYRRIAERRVSACGYGPIAAVCHVCKERGARTGRAAPVCHQRRCHRGFRGRGLRSHRGDVRVATWSAPGKVFLFGEHAVVYGKPGIAMAIKPRVFVTVRKSRMAHHAKSPYIDNCFDEMGVRGSVYVNSQLPSSSGLGSSAAVTVATLSAINDEFGKKYKAEEIADMAFAIEKKVQKGRASPTDTTVSTFGGLVFITGTSRRRLAPQHFHLVDRELHGPAQHGKDGGTGG